MTHVDSTLTEGGSLARRSPIRTGLLWNVLAVGSLWAVIAAFFWRIGLAGRVLAGGDAFTYFYPYWAARSAALRVLRLPLWNPDLPVTERYRDQWDVVPDNGRFDNGFKYQWEEFVRHVVEGTPFPYDLLSGARGVQLAELGLRSSEEGRRIVVPELVL